MKLVLAMMLMAGCGSVVEVSQDPETAEVSSASAGTPVCGEMSCFYVACFACKDGEDGCSHDMRCYCGYSDDPRYQSDEPISCACWERLPDDFHGQTGCSYTPFE